MPCPTSKRTHTPIVSEQQRKFFGAELARKKAGKKTKTKITLADLRSHLKESKGKELPTKITVMSALKKRLKRKTV